MFQILDQKFKGNKTPKEAFAEWCQEYAGKIYPDLGDVAHAVPPLYFNRHEIELDDQTGAWRRTRKAEHREGTDVNSDVRGDAAQRVVGRAFIVSSVALSAVNILSNLCLPQVCFLPPPTPTPSLHMELQGCHFATLSYLLPGFSA